MSSIIFVAKVEFGFGLLLVNLFLMGLLGDCRDGEGKI
jgi:hypothetical protein